VVLCSADVTSSYNFLHLVRSTTAAVCLSCPLCSQQLVKTLSFLDIVNILFYNISFRLPSRYEIICIQHYNRYSPEMMRSFFLSKATSRYDTNTGLFKKLVAVHGIRFHALCLQHPIKYNMIMYIVHSTIW